MRVYYNEFNEFAARWLLQLGLEGHVPIGHVDTRSIADVTADDLAGYRQAHFFAGIGGWPYALKLAGWPDRIPVWTGSCPCFVAGTLVMTARGFVPIEELIPGDLVLTHKKRYRPVTAVMTSMKETLIVKGQGCTGIETTSEHPFLTGNDTWTVAADMRGRRWACVCDVPQSTVPSLPPKDWIGKSQVPDMTSPAFWKFVGYWLGDGWTRDRKQVVICGGHDDAQLLSEMVAACGLHGNPSTERTGVRLRIGSKLLAAWLDDNFGHGASSKMIPTWLLAQPIAVINAFAEGLLLADGHVEKQENGKTIHRLTTTSKAVAIGFRVIMNKLGKSATITRHIPDRSCVIEGRQVAERGFYRVTVYGSSRSFRFENGYGWGLVRETRPSGVVKQVFNIAVAEDESYTADGIVVHNCQPFSTAGKRGGFEDERHLWPTWFKLIQQCRPPVVFGEQVASGDGRTWLAAVRSDLESVGYVVGAADLCAAGVGAPHIRQRLYWMAYAAGGRPARVSRREQEGAAERGAASVPADGLAHTLPAGRPTRGPEPRNGSATGGGGIGGLADTHQPGRHARAFRGIRQEEDAGRSWHGQSERPGGLDVRSENTNTGLGHTVRGGRHPAEPAAGNGERVVWQAITQDAGDRQWMADPDGRGRGLQESQSMEGPGHGSGTQPATGGPDDRVDWRKSRWLVGRDGKARPVEPGVEPLAHGVPARVEQLRGYGNAIVPALAAAFIRASRKAIQDIRRQQREHEDQHD